MSLSPLADRLRWSPGKPPATAGFLASDARLRRRRRNERVARILLGGAALACVGILVILLWRIAADGFPHMGWQFWVKDYSPGELRRGVPTGVQDSLKASVTVLLVTMGVALPVGTAAGVYMHEYAPANRLTGFLRTTISNLAGVPSVVYGLLGLAVFVRMMQLGANLLAAALTMSCLILPILIVATEEALKTVPASVREASLALGATKWQTLRSHVLPYALPGILTGNILALSRAAGETAPLLLLGIPAFLAFAESRPIIGDWPLPNDLGTPLQVRIYALTNNPLAEAQSLAAAAIVLLLLATLALNLVAILLRQFLANRIRW